MTADNARISIRERLRWSQVPRQIGEELLAGVLLLLPRRVCAQAVRCRLARRAFGCAPEDVHLFKSGRAALRGLLEGLRAVAPDRRTAFVPDYVCNVVGEACRAAGFAPEEYATDERCLPRWKELEERVRQESAPVVVLCSLFGSVPAQMPEAESLGQANPRIFIVADECQNLVPDSPVKPRANRAVVFSFNDKTCPGIMGGGVVCPAGGEVVPRFRKEALFRRCLCSLALFRLWGLRIVRDFLQMARLACGIPPAHRMPPWNEYSTCRRPHYDLAAEPIYRLSAARAWVGLLSLASYRRFRAENAKALRSAARGPWIGRDDSAIEAGPPFLPVGAGVLPLPEAFPAPVKAAYGRSAAQASGPNPRIALKTNVPYARYEACVPVVAQLTSRHAVTDNRILHGMARTAETAGYRSVVMGPAREDGHYGQVQLMACPVLKEGRRPPHAWLLACLLAGALSSRYPLLQIHDPDLLPVGLMLKLFGRRVVYDVHDDYEASFKDRFRQRRWLGAWFPRVWWMFERNAARRFDGVVVADRHLARKFERCRPVVMGNYPRLDFTPKAQAEAEKTFNLIYVGGVSRERGLEKAMDALNRLTMPDLRLHVIGTGRESDLIARLNADPRVVMHGRVPWPELHRHYVRAHVGLALYQPLECFLYCPGENAVKVIEYMAAGIPVLCADFPGLKVFVEDSGCGRVVRPDDPEAIAAAIRQLYEDAGLRQRCGANGRRLFEEEYHWEKQEHRLVELYGRILKA